MMCGVLLQLNGLCATYVQITASGDVAETEEISQWPSTACLRHGGSHLRQSRVGQLI
jgi:hypothetical protein